MRQYKVGTEPPDAFFTYRQVFEHRKASFSACVTSLSVMASHCSTKTAESSLPTSSLLPRLATEQRRLRAANVLPRTQRLPCYCSRPTRPRSFKTVLAGKRCRHLGRRPERADGTPGPAGSHTRRPLYRRWRNCSLHWPTWKTAGVEGGYDQHNHANDGLGGQ
jgi:hypothetical protein